MYTMVDTSTTRPTGSRFFGRPAAWLRPRLPAGLADFANRGFRTDRPAARSILQTHAGAFLTGFNLAAARWREVHEALARVPPGERGFAYEGAGMYAALRDRVTPGRWRSLATLLSGPGDGYTHLIHTGAGWTFAPLRLPLPPPLPATPLLRWLALDGAGFGEVFFGGPAAFARRVRRAPDPLWRIRVAGCGRALWFVECADPAAITARVLGAPELARPWLWSGIGLAAGYAGAIDAAGLSELVAASGAHRTHLAQGVVFATSARLRSGAAPEHTELACRHVLGVAPERAAAWAETAGNGLFTESGAGAYLEWKARIRELIDHQE